jgi:hypothetical protein
MGKILAEVWDQEYKYLHVGMVEVQQKAPPRN